MRIRCIIEIETRFVFLVLLSLLFKIKNIVTLHKLTENTIPSKSIIDPALVLEEVSKLSPRSEGVVATIFKEPGAALERVLTETAGAKASV